MPLIASLGIDVRELYSNPIKGRPVAPLSGVLPNFDRVASRGRRDMRDIDPDGSRKCQKPSTTHRGRSPVQYCRPNETETDIAPKTMVPT